MNITINLTAQEILNELLARCDLDMYEESIVRNELDIDEWEEINDGIKQDMEDLETDHQRELGELEDKIGELEDKIGELKQQITVLLAGE